MPAKSAEQKFFEKLPPSDVRYRTRTDALIESVHATSVLEWVDDVFDAIFGTNFGNPKLIGGDFGNAGAVHDWEANSEPMYIPRTVINPCWELCVGSLQCEPGQIAATYAGQIASGNAIYDFTTSNGDLCTVSRPCPVDDTDMSGASQNFIDFTPDWSHQYAARVVQQKYDGTGYWPFSAPYWRNERTAAFRRVCSTSEPPLTQDVIGIPPPGDANEEKHKPTDEPEEEREKKIDLPPWKVEFVPIVPFAPLAPPVPPTPRAPRPRRSKDKKVRSKLSQIMKVIDQVSEASEIVDSLFRALPCDVQEKAEKNFRDEIFPLDKAGQFGIELADQKAKAIYDNWDSLDADLALSNIVRNQIEDKLYGLAAKHAGKGGLKAAGAGQMFGGEARKKNADIDEQVDHLTPFNDIVSKVLDHSTIAFGLVPERKCE